MHLLIDLDTGTPCKKLQETNNVGRKLRHLIKGFLVTREQIASARKG